MSERWDRDRVVLERDRVEDDTYYMRGGRGRERSEERFDRRRYYEDDYVRETDRPPRFHDDDSRLAPRREPYQPDYGGRRVVIEKERDREYYRSPSPRRPAFLRRQSSLDTFDRRPARQIYEPRAEYPPPARREDIYRDDHRSYAPRPLPPTRALPPSRYDDRYYDDKHSTEDRYYREEDYRGGYPERVREREIITERDKRDRSRESHATRARTHHSHSRSPSVSSRSSSSAGGTSVQSGYPKRGKTKIPLRLVSKQALIDLGYPYIEEEQTIIVQKALGQEHIDELLKLSEEYIRVEKDVRTVKTTIGGNVVEERIEERREEIVESPSAAPAPIIVPPPGPAEPLIIEAGPRMSGSVEVVDKTVIRESSPVSSGSGHHHRHRHHHHHDDGALVVVPRSRSRSHSRSHKDIRAEIRHLERQLAHRPKGDLEREVVRTERLPDGQLVVYEEEVERTVAGPKPPRIEKDKKGPPPALLRAMLGTLT